MGRSGAWAIAMPVGAIFTFSRVGRSFTVADIGFAVIRGQAVLELRLHEWISGRKSLDIHRDTGERELFIKSAFAANPYGARLTPHQVGAIRYQIVRLVERALADMQAVLDGTKEASPQQVALFLKLLDKVLPTTRKAPNDEPEKKDTSWVRSLSVADLQRLLAETLGEAPPAPAPPPAPTKAELAAERERQYQQGFERRHPELRQRRAEANAKRFASTRELGQRIKARKAAEPPDGPWSRATG